MAAALFATGAAHAQIPSIVKTGLGFLNTGGYYFSGNAGAGTNFGVSSAGRLVEANSD